MEVKKIGQKHPLGGNLLDRQFVARAQAFLRNVCGIVFYVTPHSGLDMKNFLHFLKKAFVEVFGAVGIMKNMTILSKPMGVLSTDFENVVQKYNINVYAFLEGRPQFGLVSLRVSHAKAHVHLSSRMLVSFVICNDSLKEKNAIIHNDANRCLVEQQILHSVDLITSQGTYVVPHASAFQPSNRNYYKVEDAMHEEVCRPPSKEHPSYQKLLENLKVFQVCDFQITMFEL